MSLIIPLQKHIWTIAAIGLGVIISIVIIHIMQFINVSLYPIPESVNSADSDSYEWFLQNHTQFLLGLLLSNVTGSFFGGAVARLTHYSVTIRTAGWVGGILLLLEMYNLITVNYPVWFWILMIALYIPSAWAGAYFTVLNQTKDEVKNES